MSIIAAGTTAGTALKSTGNTDGTIQLQVNGTTPSVTLATTGAIGVGSTPGYGTSGQVLQSAGSAAAPTWATPATGAMALIATVTPTATTYVNFLTTFTASYNTYLIVGENLRPALASYIAIQFASGGTAITSGYGALIGASVNAGGAGSAFSDDRGHVSRITTSATGSANFYCWITGINTTNLKSGISYSSVIDGTPNFNGYASAFGVTSGTIGGFRLFWNDAGNWVAQGKVYVYGVANA